MSSLGRYDEALICKNGHVINESANRNPEFNTKFATNVVLRLFVSA